MLANLLRIIAKPFIGTGVSKYFPFLKTVYGSVYSKNSGTTIVQIPSDSQLKVWNNDSGVGLFLLSKGKYEPYQTELLADLAKNKDLIFDIGANIGYYTAQFGKLAKKVVAVEPDREVMGLLNENIALNGLQNVVIKNMAIGHVQGELGLKVSKANRANSELVYGGEFDYKVNVDTLDNLVAEVGMPELIKVDVEGSELQFLQGGKETLSGSKHPVLVMEYNPEALEGRGTNPEDVLKLLEEYGYRLKIISEHKSGLLAYSPENLREIISSELFVNLLCK